MNPQMLDQETNLIKKLDRVTSLFRWTRGFIILGAIAFLLRMMLRMKILPNGIVGWIPDEILLFVLIPPQITLAGIMLLTIVFLQVRAYRHRLKDRLKLLQEEIDRQRRTLI
jgi:hypothetical protein